MNNLNARLIRSFKNIEMSVNQFEHHLNCLPPIVTAINSNLWPRWVDKLRFDCHGKITLVKDVSAHRRQPSLHLDHFGAFFDLPIEQPLLPGEHERHEML